MQFKTGRILRYLLFFMMASAIIYFFFLVREVLYTFALGAILAYLLFRPVSIMGKKGLKRVWAILILYLLVIIILTAFFSLALPGMVKELGDLAGLLPGYAQTIDDFTGRMGKMDMTGQLTPLIDENINQAKNSIYNMLKNFVGSFYDLLGKLLALIFSPILAFYIMNDWEKIKNGFLNLLSPRARRQVLILTEEIDDALIEFLKGHLMVAAFVGTATGLAALLAGVKFPLLIGVLAGVADLIPYFGPFLGAVPAVLIALTDSLHLAFTMALAVLIIQQVESNIITPRIIGGRLGMHPLLIVFALLSGGELWGIWGMLAAVPVAAVLKVIAGWAYLKLVEQ